MKQALGIVVAAGLVAAIAQCKKDEPKAEAPPAVPPAATQAAPAVPAQPGTAKDLMATGLQLAAQAASAAAEAAAKGKSGAEMAGAAAEAAVKGLGQGFDKIAEAAGKIAQKAAEGAGQIVEGAGREAAKLGAEILGKMLGGGETGATGAPPAAAGEQQLPPAYLAHFPQLPGAKVEAVMGTPGKDFMVHLGLTGQTIDDVANTLKAGVVAKGWTVANETAAGPTRSLALKKGDKIGSVQVLPGAGKIQVVVSSDITP